ncbi:MAG: S46 family peptidase [Gammaproteobacteria bacterium]
MRIIFAILISVTLSLAAREGMWEPHQMPLLKKELRNAGFTKDIRSISDLFEFPMNAIVSIGGCSAAFVSPNGLIATNYHCVEGSYLQYNSNKEIDLFATGFTATKFEEEKPSAPGGRVYITTASKEITHQVLAGTDQAENYSVKAEIIEQNSKDIINACETGENIRCRVISFFDGETYKLEVQTVLKDVRLVYAPPSSIGEYGGEIDNWMYPRHTGDFALLRAYVSPDGSSKEFDKANVPFKPETFLKISAQGVSKGDFVMVIGYPGSTNRLRTFTEINYDLTYGFARSVEFLKRGIELIEENTKGNEELALKYRGLKSGYENYYKKIAGQLDGSKKFNVLDAEQIKWSQFMSFVETHANPEEKEELNLLFNLIQKQQNRYIAERYYGNSSLISNVFRIFKNADEQTKPNEERDSGYQERDQVRIKNSLQSTQYRFDASVDKSIFIDRLKTYKAFDRKLRRSEFSKNLKLDGSLNETLEVVDEIYSSQFSDPTKMLQLFEKTFDEINAIDDPLINFIKNIYLESKDYEKQADAERAERQKLRSTFIKLSKDYYQQINKPLYADANGTLRVTYGNVMGLELQDGIEYKPFTTLEGVVEKHQGEVPFNAPEILRDLVQKRDYGSYFDKDINSVPVNFISDLDITNGNSGSATINKDFELVGLAFDGMLETIISDYKYIPEARTISVDSRYLLWNLEKIAKAENILSELNIVR